MASIAWCAESLESRIPELVAIKVAPFDRYETLAVARAVAESGRDIALYTGNDDNILGDLLTPFVFPGRPPLDFRGGLLGQWAIWTRRAVESSRNTRRSSASSTAWRGERWRSRRAPRSKRTCR